MLTNAIKMGENFSVDVITTDNRGLTPEEVTAL